MKIELMDKTKKKKFIEELSYLGIEKISVLLLKTGNEKIRGFSGSLSNEELMALWRLFPVEGVGLYFGKDIIDRRTGKKEARLSLDALHFLKNEIKKGIVILNKEQEEKWFRGDTIELEKEQTEETDFVAVKSESDDFIGTGKVSQNGKILINFLPKERRRKD